MTILAILVVQVHYASVARTGSVNHLIADVNVCSQMRDSKSFIFFVAIVLDDSFSSYITSFCSEI